MSTYEVSAIDAIFSYIRKNGQLQTPNKTIGGMWSRNVWELNGDQAVLEDEGSTLMIRSADRSIVVRETYSRSAVYSSGDIGLLKSFYGRVIGEDDIFNKLG